MINDQTYLKEESELNKLFAEAGWSEVPRPNELRIQKIEERALSERIVKDSINFVFSSFESVLTGFADALLVSREIPSQDYKV